MGEIEVFYGSIKIGSFKVVSGEEIKNKNMMERIRDFYNGLNFTVRITLIVSISLLILSLVGVSIYFSCRSKRKRTVAESAVESLDDKENQTNAPSGDDIHAKA